MRFAFKAEISPPAWLMPTLHTAVTGAGMTYVQIAEQPVAVTTAVVFVMGVSYGRILNAWAARKASAGRVKQQ
ncbi:hypothetical protein ABZ297_34685 [Nonomuraea sp. NPDC005983]|uniref:hypothetical protein n=1 Tax=Nonomuraea sp. NPDC005983 TaxID=3155595 RepID=UPI0033A54550